MEVDYTEKLQQAEAKYQHKLQVLEEDHAVPQRSAMKIAAALRGLQSL